MGWDGIGMSCLSVWRRRGGYWFTSPPLPPDPLSVLLTTGGFVYKRHIVRLQFVLMRKPVRSGVTHNLVVHSTPYAKSLPHRVKPVSSHNLFAAISFITFRAFFALNPSNSCGWTSFFTPLLTISSSALSRSCRALCLELWSEDIVRRMRESWPVVLGRIMERMAW